MGLFVSVFLGQCPVCSRDSVDANGMNELREKWRRWGRGCLEPELLGPIPKVPQPRFPDLSFQKSAALALDPQRCSPGSPGPHPGAGLVVGDVGSWKKGGRRREEAAGGHELPVKAILSPPASSAVATCQKNRQGKEMTKKKSGPIYHLEIVLNKLPELLGFEELPLFPPVQNKHH